MGNGLANGSAERFAGQFQRNVAAIDRQRVELNVPQIPEIFLRAEESVRATTFCGSFQISRFPLRIDMMIVKTAFSG
jgi:hypothetical protein